MTPSRQLRVLGWIVCVVGILATLPAIWMLIALLREVQDAVGKLLESIALALFAAACAVALLGFACTRGGRLGRSSALLLGGLPLLAFSATQLVADEFGPTPGTALLVLEWLPIVLAGSYLAALGLASTLEAWLASRLSPLLQSLLPVALAAVLFGASAGARALLYPYSIEARIHRQVFGEAASRKR